MKICVQILGLVFIGCWIKRVWFPNPLEDPIPGPFELSEPMINYISDIALIKEIGDMGLWGVIGVWIGYIALLFVVLGVLVSSVGFVTNRIVKKIGDISIPEASLNDAKSDVRYQVEPYYNKIWWFVPRRLVKRSFYKPCKYSWLTNYMSILAHIGYRLIAVRRYQSERVEEFIRNIDGLDN